eukprot:TRINITY_DN8802_c0_g1_i1.p1 TRINITY_DN8802_c0_g1~~TRINITY_DN8802_c0_g1_i1.p1  ORF type:complete len:316 (+),score=40.00 TRINITY_DN8802_c0_g1_i1:267-1214(+)
MRAWARTPGGRMACLSRIFGPARLPRPAGSSWSGMPSSKRSIAGRSHGVPSSQSCHDGSIECHDESIECHDVQIKVWRSSSPLSGWGRPNAWLSSGLSCRRASQRSWRLSQSVIGNLAWEVPPEGCRCPITLDIFYDPATCSRSGQRYELSALAPWIAEHATEPLTRLPYDFSVPLKIDDRMRVQLAEWRGRRVVSLLERARGTSEAAVVCGLLQEAIDCDPRNMELHALLVDACEQDGLAEEAEAARENLRRQMCEAEERCAMEAMLAANQEHLHRVRLVAEQLRNRSPLQQPAPPLEHPPVPCSMIRKVDNTD